MFFNNLFGLNGESTEIYVDTFTSPEDWSPCQEVPKTVTAQNKNSTVRYARMKIDEYWRLKGSQISDPDDHTTTELPLTWNDNGTIKSYAIINTQNDSDWELKSDGWYYYKTPLVQDAITNSLLKSVTLNCDAKLVTNGTAIPTQTGQSGESVPTDYAGATYHVYVTMQLSDTEWEEPVDPQALTTEIKRQVNPDTTNIDFRKYAVVSDDPVTANGNGVNKATENGKDVYYYRGEVANNNVIFADMCWKILRTTATGGVKLVYNGYPQGPSGSQSCSGAGSNSMYTAWNSAPSNTELQKAPTWAGYMYGKNYRMLYHSDPETYFSSAINYPPYSLDIGTDKSSYGSLYNGSTMAPVNGKRQFYICYGELHAYGAEDEKAHNCYLNTSEPEVGYIIGWDGGNSDTIINDTSRTIFYVVLDGESSIQEVKDAMFANDNPSNMKTYLDNYYQNTLSSFGNMLEDPVFCNDRSFSSGSLSSTSPIFVRTTDWYNAVNYTNIFSGYYRNAVDYGNNYHPSLNCPNKHDAFTVSDTTNGNGDLTYPIGLMTADEMTMSGIPFIRSNSGVDQTPGRRAYLYYGTSAELYSMTMTPAMEYADSFGNPHMMVQMREIGYHSGATNGAYGLRPVVSLKAGVKFVQGTDGTAANPYVLQQ